MEQGIFSHWMRSIIQFYVATCPVCHNRPHLPLIQHLNTTPCGIPFSATLPYGWPANVLYLSRPCYVDEYATLDNDDFVVSQPAPWNKTFVMRIDYDPNSPTSFLSRIAHAAAPQPAYGVFANEHILANTRIGEVTGIYYRGPTHHVDQSYQVELGHDDDWFGLMHHIINMRQAGNEARFINSNVRGTAHPNVQTVVESESVQGVGMRYHFWVTSTVNIMAGEQLLANYPV